MEIYASIWYVHWDKKLRRFVRSVKKLILKVCYFTNTKDRTPLTSKSIVVYRFCCPGCSAEYIGKTDRNLHERCLEHTTTKDSAILTV